MADPTKARPGLGGPVGAAALLATVLIGLGILYVPFVRHVLSTDPPAPPSARFVDFAVFWVASKLTLAGDAELVFDNARFRDASAALIGSPLPSSLVWRNPPGFLLVTLPLGAMPFAVAWLAWLGATAGMLVAAIRLLPMGWTAAGAVLLAPASVMNVALGQNGFLTAAILCAIMALLDRRPVAAGLLIALLTYKPQFGVVFPLLLAASGRWRCFAAACVGTAMIFGATALAFGPGIWVSFLASLGGSAANLAGGGEYTYFYTSAQSVLRQTGAAPGLAWSVHGVLAMGALLFALILWRRPKEDGAEVRGAVTLAACMLMTPYVFYYDQVVLPVAALFFASAAAKTGWLPWERTLLWLVCLLPIVHLVVKAPVIGLLGWLVVLALAWRRAGRPGGVGSMALRR